MAEGVLESILGGEEADEAEAEARGGGDPLAMSAALEAARQDPKLASRLGAYVDQQARLVGIQTEHLHEQRDLVLSHLRWRRVSDRMKAVLQVMTACVGLAIVAGIGWMAWEAHESDGLVIEPFNTPPEFASQGLSGQVLASRLLDGVRRLQDGTISPESPRTLEHGWAKEVRVEIPETGVSVGELQSLFRNWLGHDVRVSGELTRDGQNLTLTLRAGADPVEPITGPASNPDALIAKAAEELYGATQPERYARWLRANNRNDDAIAIYRRLSITGSRRQRARALVGWTGALGDDPIGSIQKDAEALRLDPEFPTAWANLADNQIELGRWEAGLRSARRSVQLYEGPRRGDFAPWYTRLHAGDQRANIANVLDQALVQAKESEAAGDPAPDEPVVACRECAASAMFNAAFAYGLIGDGPAMRERIAKSKSITPNSPYAPMLDAFGAAALALGIEDWPAVLSGVATPAVQTMLDPFDKTIWRAQALAHLGRTADALRSITAMPKDCYPCVTVEGEIRALVGDWRGAEAAFARAVRLGPDLPWAHVSRGRSLLARGDAKDALAEAVTALSRSSHDASAGTLKGEALMALGEYSSAAEAFAAADADAPRWGRNHLKWGEALMLAGRYAEARAQFVAAEGMDLNAPDRAALNVLLARTASGHLHG